MRLVDAEQIGLTDMEIIMCDGNYKKALEMLIDKIANAPTVEVPQRIRGKWIPHHDEVMLFDGISTGGVSFSECGWKTYNKMHLLFGCPYRSCPKCGAEMREE